MIKTYKSDELGNVTIPEVIMVEVFCPNCNRFYSIDEDLLGESRCNWCETNNLLEER